MANYTANNESERSTEYERMTKEEWSDAVESHVKHLSAKVQEAARRAVAEYLVTVFAGAEGKEFDFIGDIIERTKDELGFDPRLERNRMLDMIKLISMVSM